MKQLKIVLILISFFCFFFSSCFEKEKKEETCKYPKEYIFKQNKDTIRIDSATGDTITFMTTFYHDINIILIDSIKEIYYHKVGFFCMTGSNPNNIIPRFRGFEQEKFKKANNLKDLFQQITQDSCIIESIYLACNNDTINDERYFAIKEVVDKFNLFVSTRLITEEENAIMDAIIHNYTYNRRNINWENTSSVFYFDKIKIIEETN